MTKTKNGEKTETGMGPSILHLGCGEDYQPDALNVDAVPDVNPDMVVDLNEYPWPFENASFREVRANHVLEHLDDLTRALGEITRVLKPGGNAFIRLPIGVDARADPTHQHDWTWRTPEFYTGSRHWDADVGLELVERDVRLWSHLPNYTGILHSILLRASTSFWPLGEWAFALPASSGEFILQYRRTRQ